MMHRPKPSNRTLLSWMVIALLLAVVIVGCTPVSSTNLATSDPTAAAGNNAQLNSALTARKQVLVIHSYHVGYKWTDDMMRGITEVFKANGGVDLRVEYLDAKRINDEEYLEQVFQLFQDKYQNAHLDLIMSSDDAALNFLFKHADSLFPEVPVVFVGANFFDETRLQGFERFTGISEEADVAGTLDLALSLHPETRNIVVVNDTSVTGQNMHKILKELIPQYPQLTFEFLEDVTMQEVQQRVGTLSPDSVVLVTIFFNDKAGGFYEYDQFTSLIAESSSVPVYGTWDFSLGYGIVGGKLTSGYTEGERGANLALRILNGADPRTLPVEKRTQSNYMFDYTVMEKWDIAVSSLPQDSMVLNRPVSFYEENRTLVLSVSIGFIALLFLIVFLVINNNQRRLAQKELAHSNDELKTLQVSLEQRVDERTKALSSVAEVSTAASTILETDKLLQQVVDLAKERFGFYHSHIYLLDEQSRSLVLSSGAGDVGRQMVAEGRSIPLDREQSLVARAAREGKGVSVNDVTTAPDFLPNPLLPDTRSELAVPMMVGEQVIGVFDVQSEVVGRFTESDIAVQMTLASQVASAVQNARFYSETLEAQKLTRNVIDSTDDWIFIKDQDHRYRLVNQGYANSLHIPIADFIGKNDIELGFPEDLVKGNPEKGIRGFWADDRAVMDGGVTKQIPNDFVTIDGALRVFDTVKVPLRDADNKVWGVLAFARDMTERRRLEEINRKRATQQEAINLVTQKIQGATNVEAALQIAARELGHVLGRRQTLVTLNPVASADNSKANVTK